MIRHNEGGGGNAHYSVSQNNGVQPVIVRRTAAIGDALCATVVADKLVDLGYEVAFQTHPSIHCVLRRHPNLHSVSDPNSFCHVDLDGAYENDPSRRFRHFHAMFMERAQQQLLPRGIQLGSALNCKPRLLLPECDKAAMRVQLDKYPRPWVFLCPRSNTYNVRQISDGVWQAAAEKIHGTKFWLGFHPAPPGIVDLHCHHFDLVIVYMAVADLLVTVDTGPMHVAAAFGTPVVAIEQSSSPQLHLNDQNDFVTVQNPALDCLNCQKNVCPVNPHLPPCQNISPELIASWANARAKAYSNGKVSAVVPIYQPDAGTLRHCLENLLPQVSEIIVTREGNSILPKDLLQHDKIRYVLKREGAIGYGRNVNFGVRHTNGEWLLLVNDDVFLEPDAVAKMLECVKPDTGMVANLLRYPEGTIYHAGKFRAPGMRGWGHLDHRQYHPTIKEPTEMENVCGACVLVRRKAFYQINGFDERFFVYAEDDDMALSLRRAGWKIMFTPHSRGIHMEHQSTEKVGNITDHLQRSNAIFGQKWGAYFDWNINRVPGNFDYLKV